MQAIFSHSLYSFNRQFNRTKWIIVGAVFILHCCFVLLSIFWQSAPKPIALTRSKVLVQTVQLNPAPEKNTATRQQDITKASIPVPLENEIAMETEKTLPPETVVKPAIIPAQEPSPAQKNKTNSIESKPNSVKPKPSLSETKKQNLQKDAPKITPKPQNKPLPQPAVPSKPKTETTSPKADSTTQQQKALAEAEKKRQQEVKQKSQEKLAQARASLSKIEEQRTKPQISIASNDTIGLPQLIGKLEIDSLPITASPPGAVWGVQESRYQDKLIAQLESQLKLPDYGTIQLKLELNRAGKVVQLHIVKSENSKNQAYVERVLPSLTFPPFGKEFEGTETYIFTITLRNKT